MANLEGGDLVKERDSDIKSYYNGDPPDLGRDFATSGIYIRAVTAAVIRQIGGGNAMTSGVDIYIYKGF